VTVGRGSSMPRGRVAVETGAQLLISIGGATLTGVTVDDDSTAAGAAAGIDVVSGILTLNGATQIDGADTGTLTIGAGGELLINGATAGGATLDGVVVGNGGSGIVVTGAALTLDDNTTITNGALTVSTTR